MDGHAKKEFDPAVLDTLARELGVGTTPLPESKEAVYRVAARKLAQLLAYAETNPEAWRLLLRFIWERADEDARASSHVDPDKPRDQGYNWVLINAGRAKSLQELVFALQPKSLKKQLDKTLSLCDNSRVENVMEEI
jgi:hypothetical protein